MFTNLMFANWLWKICAIVVILTVASGQVGAQKSASSPDWENEPGGRSFRSDRINVPRWRMKNGPHVRLAFREVVADARQATVRVRGEGRDIALGAIVGAEGWVLTKASRLPKTISCQLADSREFDARIVNINRDFDLALLKINAERLPTLELEQLTTPKVGAWLATVGMKRGPVAVGVMSVEPRTIRHRAGTLGVRLGEESARAVIVEIFPHTGAADAGLLVEDLVLSVGGKATPTRAAFVRRVQEHRPGDEVMLRVQRGDEILAIEATLKERRPWRLQTRNEFQNQLGGLLSKRRFGFPRAFQHDTVVKPSDCGGPVVNLDGQMVGLNIARAGRTETYAIPVATVVKLLREMMPERVSEPALVGEAP